MDLRELGKRGLRYMLWHVVLTVALIVLGLIWPAIAERSLGFAVTMAAASLTLDGFIKSHVAMPTREEYWGLVGVSTAVALALNFAFLLTALSIRSAEPLSFSGWAFVVALSLMVTVLANMFGYSKIFAGAFLKGRREKLAKDSASNSGS